MWYLDPMHRVTALTDGCCRAQGLQIPPGAQVGTASPSVRLSFAGPTSRPGQQRRILPLPPEPTGRRLFPY